MLSQQIIMPKEVYDHPSYGEKNIFARALITEPNTLQEVRQLI